MVLACYLISQDHLMKRYWDFMGRSPSRQNTILQSLVGVHQGKLLSYKVWWPQPLWQRSYNDFDFRMILKDHVIKGSCDFMGGGPS